MQLSLFPLPTYAELCILEQNIFFHCAICFKKQKRGTGIENKFCSEKHREEYQKWEEEFKEIKGRIER